MHRQSSAVLLLLSAVCVAGIPDQEVSALRSLHRSTNGSAWRRNRWPGSFDSGTACGLPGVTCAAGHVVMLSFENSFSGGHIPSSLSGKPILSPETHLTH